MSKTAGIGIDKVDGQIPLKHEKNLQLKNWLIIQNQHTQPETNVLKELEV